MLRIITMQFVFQFVKTLRRQMAKSTMPSLKRNWYSIDMSSGRKWLSGVKNIKSLLPLSIIVLLDISWMMKQSGKKSSMRLESLVRVLIEIKLKWNWGTNNTSFRMRSGLRIMLPLYWTGMVTWLGKVTWEFEIGCKDVNRWAWEQICLEAPESTI